MKKVYWFLSLLILVNVGIEIYVSLDDVAKASRAYQDEATLLAHSRRLEPPFTEIHGHIVDVTYILESMQRESDHAVRLVALQSVHFRKGASIGNWGSRRIARTRHHVLMIKTEGRWRISQLEEGGTEIGGIENGWLQK